MTGSRHALQVLSISLLIALTIPLLSPNHLTYPTAHASSKTISLVANSVGTTYYWNSTNPTITVTQGDSITLDLSSTGGVPHRFLLDFDGDGVSDTADCSPTPPTTDPCSSSPYFTTSATVSFTTTTVGSFNYYCTIHYPSMVGQFIVQGFTTSPNPSSITTVQGMSGTSSLTLTSVNGFAGNVALSYSAQAGITTSFNPTSLTLTSGSSGTSQATIFVANTVMTGSYAVTLIGTSGSITQSSTVTVTVIAPGSPDFTMTPSPTSSTVNSGVNGSSTITIAPLNGFTGTVDLASGTNSASLICSLNPTSISGGSGTAALSCSSSTAANYLATISGTSGALVHSVSVIYHVQDFSISANPASISVTQGSTGSITITLSGLNGFSSTLSLAGRASPSGPGISFGPASVTLSGGSATSTLTISASGGLYSSVATGNYSVNVTAASGSLSHSTRVQVTVASSTSSGSGALNLPLSVWVGVAVVLIAAVATAVFLMRRKATKET